MAVSAKLKRIFFGRYLWVTNTVTGGVFLAVGDGIQQNVEKARGLKGAKEPLDKERTGRMMLVGLALGLPHHIWYTWLDRFMPGSGLLVVAKKILMDQTMASPYFNFSFFMGSGLLEGNGLRGSWDEFKDKFAMVYKTDCSVWPAAQLINFMFVPAIYRVVYINTLTVAWNVFLSYAKYFDKIEVIAEKEMLALA